MRYVLTSDRSNADGLDGRHDNRVAVERCEFDLKRLPFLIDMNDSADVTGDQVRASDGSRQYDLPTLQ